MTPNDIQRMMDFILRTQSDGVIRAEKFKEEFDARDAKLQEKIEKLQLKIDSLAAEIREVMKTQREQTKSQERSAQRFEKSQQRLAKSQQQYEKSQRQYEKRLRALESSDRRARRRVEGIKDLMKLFSKRSDVHSHRLDRIEGSL